MTKSYQKFILLEITIYQLYLFSNDLDRISPFKGELVQPI